MVRRCLHVHLCRLKWSQISTPAISDLRHGSVIASVSPIGEAGLEMLEAKGKWCRRRDALASPPSLYKKKLDMAGRPYSVPRTGKQYSDIPASVIKEATRKNIRPDVLWKKKLNRLKKRGRLFMNWKINTLLMICSCDVCTLTAFLMTLLSGSYLV